MPKTARPSQPVPAPAPGNGNSAPAPVEVRVSSDPAAALGATLVEELQQRCESLRVWHAEALASLSERETKLDSVKQKLAAGRAELEAGKAAFAAEIRQEREVFAAEVRAEREALDRDRKEREAELVSRINEVAMAQSAADARRGELDDEAHALESDRDKLDRARAAVADQREELKQLRAELDTEWSSLTRVRRAQEALADALDADRQRMNADTFQLQPVNRAA